MTRTALLFGALLARELTMTLRYRWWLALMQISALVAPVITLLVWRGAISLGAQPPVGARLLTTYLVLVSMVGMLTSSWTANFLATSIRLGGVSSWLIRPCSTHLASLANNVAEKLVKLVLLAPMIALVGWIFRDELSLPAGGIRWLLFGLSLLPALGISFCLDVTIGSLAFWFEDISAIDRLRSLLSRTLSGAFIPLALFPPNLAGFLNAQPFRYVVSFPLEVLLGAVPGGTEHGFAVQLAWFAGFLACAVAVWRVGLHRYQGASA
jgi:ABC-2 type transport system permease protein